ncbi:MAG: pseudouridine synthase [Candidatus Uhrbacteria bacterium]
MATRINKYLADHGYCSRREADALIIAGSVFINGKRAELGDKAEETDRVRIVGQAKRVAPKKIYLMMNKPIGAKVTTDWRLKEKSVMELIPKKDRLFPIGRLDVNTAGLLLFTNDGDLALKLTHPRYANDHEYEVVLDKAISDAHLLRLAEGVDVNGEKTPPAIIRRQSQRGFTLIQNEGDNKRIRRMCDAFGYTVQKLTRVRVGTVRLGLLQLGKTRELTDDEVKALKRD